MAVSQGYRTAERIVKNLGKEIKKSISKDREKYFNKDFEEGVDRSNAWKTAKVILGVNSNSSPTGIKIKNEKGEMKEVTNPEDLAKLFNNYFNKKG